MKTFELLETRKIIVQEGWGVDVVPIWEDWAHPEYGINTNGSRIAEIFVSVTEISPDTVFEVEGVWCVHVPDTQNGGADVYNVPVVNFERRDDLTQDDTHDLRTRWFATMKEANEWADLVRSRWDNPEPWRNFVCL